MRINASVFLQLLAVGCSCVTLADCRYDFILTVAMVLSITAFGLVVSAFRNGGNWNKAICILVALPSTFVMAEFFRRVSFLR